MLFNFFRINAGNPLKSGANALNHNVSPLYHNRITIESQCITIKSQLNHNDLIVPFPAKSPIAGMFSAFLQFSQNRRF